ncbi:MAG: serine O-acetyltransferase [Thermomicrobiales bacterium]|jgi:serine O-acetyltransferase|nr:serine O-acetyltransferase [Thermomicrobiales bacterium]MEA2524412.1 serine O-acetyltransferase [Thermomicrobiales bacterium]MEA2586090.1 serine O-acetyltransferase [Thermomicrobiales bacterium]MEA2594156.1 serine O-acetyltransferase [Thermomicrobiales bacterium]
MWLSEQIRTIRERDPAARSAVEIVLTYPGLHAQLFHRTASALRRRRLHLLARIVSHLGRFLTGIEIHPGATIGRRFFIDHGMGVVIGETAVIGDDCTLYQGVTLGGTGKQRGKRHPTLGDGVIVGVGAKILGAVTIGHGAKIGGGAVVLRDVPPHTTAVGVPARAVAWTDPHSGETRPLESLPDPQRDALLALIQRVEELEQQVRLLQSSHAVADEYAALT